MNLATLSHLALLVETPAAPGGPDLTRYFTVVGVLIAVVLGLGWGFRRLVSGALKTRASKRSLQIVDVLPLGGRRQLTVVRCYDRTFALGLGEKDVSLVAELDPVFHPEEQEDEQPDDVERNFLALFDRARERMARKRADEALEPTRVQEMVG